MSDRLQSLAEIEATVWRQIGAAVSDKDHAWRTPTLATALPGGGADARVVILREMRRAPEELLFFTDARSPKAHQISADARGVVVMWSPALSWQLRLAVHLSLESSGLQVSSRWARLKLTPAAQDYLAPQPPGFPLKTATLTPQRESREHFAIITARVQRIDWLELDPAGHRRAVFGKGAAQWVQA